MMQYAESAGRPELGARKSLRFNTQMSRTDAEDHLAAFFNVSPEEVGSTFQRFFDALPADGYVLFYENLEGVQRPDKFPSRPFDIVGYDSSGKALFRTVVSFPLMKGDFCSVMKTTNLRFFELSHGHRRDVLEIRERFNRLFRAETGTRFDSPART